MVDFDLAIIGGGPAGYSAALEGAKLGLKVVLFEKAQLGGTCLNRGCVPTKFLAHVGQTLTRFLVSERDGVFTENVRIDFGKTMARKEKIISNLRDGLTRQLLQQKIEIVCGEAFIPEKNHILCDGTIYAAKNILIATGSIPTEPILPGTISTNELLELQEIPKTLHILGGGVISVEFANIFRALGAEVTLYIRGDRILRKWEKEIAQGLSQDMKRQGIRIQIKCDFDHLQFSNDDLILSATGRKPNLAGMDAAWFEVGPHGGVIADSSGQTKTAGIFAAGDVLDDSPQLAHVGMEQGKYVARLIAGVAIGRAAAVVNCVFAGQEAASVGLTEEEAKAQGIEAISAKQPMYANARTMISTAQRGFIKLVGDRETGKIVGAHLLCQRAGDIVAELALAINQGLTVQELASSTRPHPSYCETVTEAAAFLAERMR